MNSALKNALAFIGGIIIGMFVMTVIIKLNGNLIAYPEGTIAGDPKSISNNIHRFEAKHFIIPLLSHVFGTLAGSYAVAKMAANRKINFAIAVGCSFLIGGMMTYYLTPGTPTNFIIIDLVLAYLPFAYLGGKLGAN